MRFVHHTHACGFARRNPSAESQANCWCHRKTGGASLVREAGGGQPKATLYSRDESPTTRTTAVVVGFWDRFVRKCKNVYFLLLIINRSLHCRMQWYCGGIRRGKTRFVVRTATFQTYPTYRVSTLQSGQAKPARYVGMVRDCYLVLTATYTVTRYVGAHSSRCSPQHKGSDCCDIDAALTVLLL